MDSATGDEQRLDWAGGFSSRSLELEFLASRRPADDALSRAVILGGALSQAVFAVIDATLLAGTSLRAPALAARAVLVSLGIALGYALPRLPIPRRDQALGALIAASLPFQAFAAMTRPPGFAGPLVSAVMAVCFVAIAVPLAARARLLLAVGVCVAHGVGRAANHGVPVGLAPPSFAVLSAVLAASVAVGVTLQRSRRLEFLALREQQTLRASLERALAEIRTLRGIVPICAFCKSIRDEDGAWHRLEVFVRDRTHAEFSHGFCPTCAAEHYPDE